MKIATRRRPGTSWVLVRPGPDRRRDRGWWGRWRRRCASEDHAWWARARATVTRDSSVTRTPAMVYNDTSKVESANFCIFYIKKLCLHILHIYAYFAHIFCIFSTWSSLHICWIWWLSIRFESHRSVTRTCRFIAYYCIYWAYFCIFLHILFCIFLHIFSIAYIHI